jgi:ubiquitin carboxyl-terminal hydrolase L3
MTMFWMYHLNLAINSYMAEKRLCNLPTFADFETILLQCPENIHAWLWSFYYSEELIFSAESKEYWRLPDLKPLPPPVATSPPRATETSPTLPPDDPERLIRFAFAVVKAYLNKPYHPPNIAPRGPIVAKALPALQSTIQRRRANPNHKHLAPYSETQAYFWIQIVHSAFASIDAIYFDRSDKSPIETKQLSYTGFQMLFQIEPTAWKRHYTEQRWNSIAARVSFINPDLASLPNVIRPESAGLTHLYLAREWERRLVNTSPELPSDEELAFYSELAMSSSTGHAQLLRSLYEAFVESERATGYTGENLAAHYHGLIDRLIEDSVDFRTKVRFWALMVLKAASGTGGESSSTSSGSFDDLLRSNRHLAYEELPLCYFSEELWNSEKAREEFVKPDRRKLDMGVGREVADAEEGSEKRELHAEAHQKNELEAETHQRNVLEAEADTKNELDDEIDEKKEWVVV